MHSRALVQRRVRTALLVLAVILLPPLLLALFVAVFGWNWARPIVERQVERATGRELEIAGDLDVDLGWRPLVRVAGVTFANAAWGREPALFAVDRLAFRFPVLPLLRGRFELDSLELDEATVALERSVDGIGNWTFAPPPREPEPQDGAPIFPAAATIARTRFVYLDHAGNREVEVLIDRAATHGGVAEPMSVELAGVYREQPFELGGELGTLAELRGDGGPSPVNLAARAGATRATLRGRAHDPPVDGLIAELTIAGPSLEALWPFTGIPLPQTPPYRARGRLEHLGDRWSFGDFDGLLGESDLHGGLDVVSPHGGRRRIEAVVRSRRVDLDDLEGFWGKRVADDDARAGVRRAGGAVFSDQPFDFDKLRGVDAAVSFRAGAVRGRHLLDDVRLDFELVRGRLELRPLALGFAGGRLMSAGVLDARRSPARFDARVVLSRLDLTRLMSDLHLPHRAAGVVGGRALLHAAGRSLAELADSADGELGVVLERGVIGETLLELVALDFSEALVAHLYGNQQAPIDCLVAVFDVANGRAEARTLLVDTEDVRITGEGWIDLGEERLDLTLRPHPKDFSIGTLRSPIEIAGSFRERRVRPQRRGLARRAGGALALGLLVHPLAALVPLVELGRGEQPGACQEALADYRQVAGSGRPAGDRRGRRPEG